MRFILGAVGGLAGFFIFQLVTGRVTRPDVRNTAIATHIAAGVGAVIFLQFMRKR